MSERPEKIESINDLALSQAELLKKLDTQEALNYWLGSKRVILSAFSKLSKKYPGKFKSQKITVIDMNCGSGDLLRSIDNWAYQHSVDLALLGLNADCEIFSIAKKRSFFYPFLQFKNIDIFSFYNDVDCQPVHSKVDILVVNNALSDLERTKIINFLKESSQKTSIALVINEFRRNWFSLLLAKILVRFVKLPENMQQQNFPVRALSKKEWIALLQSADLSSYEIRRYWFFRWQIMVYLG